MTRVQASSGSELTRQGGRPRPTQRRLTRGYTREPAVAAEIASLGIGSPEFWRRVEVGDYRDAAALRTETLVYALRVLALEGRADDAWRVAMALVDRAKRTVARRLALWRPLAPSERDEMEDEIAAKLFEEWFSMALSHEFWEVRFGVCLERTISDEIGRVQRRLRTETTLTATENAEGNEIDAWEAIPDAAAMDAEMAALVADAMAHLDEPHRTTFRMYYYLGASEEDIALHLGCTTRTVRNYLSRARARLKLWRES